VRQIRTLEDVLHAATNALTLISSHSQYLLGKLPPETLGMGELKIIYQEAERAASLLGLVPQGLAKSPVLELESPEPAQGLPGTHPEG